MPPPPKKKVNTNNFTQKNIQINILYILIYKHEVNSNNKLLLTLHILSKYKINFVKKTKNKNPSPQKKRIIISNYINTVNYSNF